MDYFEYNAARTDQQTENPTVPLEVLTFTGDEIIEVDEDHSVTVDDIREYIDRMSQSPSARRGVTRLRAA